VIAGVLVLAGCGGEQPRDGSAAPVAVADGPSGQPGQPPSEQPSLALDHPADAFPFVTVRRGERAAVRTGPGGELVTRARPRTEFGSRTVLGVVRERDGWAAITTPALANDQLGWVRLDPRELRGGWTRVSVEVDVSERRAELLERGEAVRAFAVTVGAPGSETPTGRFAVTDTFRGDLDSAYGCCALALSATQPHLPSGWLGGRRIAIHGTAGPLGVAASHGCVRAADPDVSRLVSRVPLGAPVFIRA